MIISNGFELSPESPTRVSSNSTTCIDHFIYQNINNPTVEVMEQENVSDHFPILLECKFKSDENTAKSNFRDTSFLKNPSLVYEYRRNLLISLSHNAELIQHAENIDTAFEKFEYIFEEVLEKFAPKVDIYKSSLPRKPKWYDNKVKNLRSKRNKAHRK